jgi:adenine-specific DNA-methyltransferase
MQKNKIYLKDNLDLLKEMPDKSIDLIYCDILYGTNSNDIKDYNDKLFKNTDDFLNFYRPRIIELNRVLKDNGSIYLHCDWHYSHYLKIQMDEYFGYENFRNEIIRQCTNAKNNSKNWGRIYDNILYYTKSNKFTWNFIQESKTESELLKQYNKVDENGDYYTTVPMHAKGESKGLTGFDWEHPKRGTIKLPKGRHWATTPDNMLLMDERGEIQWSRNNVPRKICYAKDYDSKYIQNIWDLKSIGSRQDYINKGGLIYDTQKPYSLLQRIILQSSNEGDLIADFFMGSGTTLEVAKDNNRFYIGCDINKKSYDICKEKKL